MESILRIVSIPITVLISYVIVIKEFYFCRILCKEVVPLGAKEVKDISL
jgi:hypothetical protein